jgi:hypothetical protein
MTAYDAVTGQLQRLAGERVRLTYRNDSAIQQTGVVSCKDYGHCVDVMLDGHGGQMYEQVTRIERMAANHRYEAAWIA